MLTPVAFAAHHTLIKRKKKIQVLSSEVCAYLPNKELFSPKGCFQGVYVFN